VIDQNIAHLDDRSLAHLRKLGLDLIVVSPFDIRWQIQRITESRILCSNANADYKQEWPNG
jgi:hypothetical protein